MTRKYTLIESLHGEKFRYSTFLNIDLQDIVIKSTGVTKFTTSI